MAKGKKINQVIDKIEDFIDRCKPQPFHADNICVPRGQLFAMFEELRANVPEEIDACAKNDCKQGADSCQCTERIWIHN